MKRTIILALLMLLGSTMVNAQKGKGTIEVLYFKTNLACCKAKACNALESDIQNIVVKNFSDSSVRFTEVKLADEANQEMVKKYNAGSQTVVLRKTTRKGEISIDVTDIIKAYLQNRDLAALEAAILTKINELKSRKK